MCQSIAEGGRRCAKSGRLEKLSAAELAPTTVGAPALDWVSDDLGALWATQGRGEVCAAVETVEAAATHDGRTFSNMETAAKLAGGELHGAAFRIKSPGSLARKLGTKLVAANFSGVGPVDPQDAVSKITDVTRYTIVSADHDGIVAATTTAVEALEKSGWHVIEAEQSYCPGNSYKGVHLLVRHEDGQVAELQIQSEHSQSLKDRAHKFYEISRDDSLTMAERRDADLANKEVYKDLPAPAGLQGLHEIGGVLVREKRYA